jgi:transketolase
MSTGPNFNPLNIPQKLAPTPDQELKYKVQVKNKNSGADEDLADPNVTRALVALMNQHAVIGGAAAHWGGPAAFAEISSSVHSIMFKDKTKDWHKQFNFVNDAGHAENGIYAIRANYGFDNLSFKDLSKFRSIESKLTGHGESHLNPEGVFISNGPLGSGLPQAQGLALGDKMLANNRTTICIISDGASMEGEAKESFASIPGLAAKGKMNPFLMIVSDNNTKLSGRIDGDSFSMNPTFESLKVLGWNIITCENGNSLECVHNKILEGLEKAQENPELPVCVWAKTVKGYGVESTATSANGGHGYPLKAYDAKLTAFVDEIFSGKTPEEFSNWAKEILASKPEAAEKKINEVPNEKVQPGFTRAAIKAVKAGLPVFSVSSDLQGSTGIAGFQKEFPEHFLDVGVQEANMVSTAVGLSKQGFIPIVDTFAQFGVTKGNLPLMMSALTQGPVIALFSHTGFQDAADGASHQATTYMAAVSAIPNTTVVNVTCSAEAEAYMTMAIESFKTAYDNGETPNSVIFFFGRENHPAYLMKDFDYKWGGVQVLVEGTDGVIVAAGPMVPKALAAQELLKKQGKNLTVINSPFVNNPDTKALGAILKANQNKLITLEDHQVIGGMGAQLIHALKLDGYNFSAKSLGIPGKFGQSAYKADHLYDVYGLSAEGVVKAYSDFS